MTSSAPGIAEDIAVAVLAAGSARRFGGGKLDALLCDRPLGRWVTDAVEATGAFARFLIVSDTPPAFADALIGWNIVTNYRASQGMGTSIHCAVKKAKRFRRLVIVLADMPLIAPSHLLCLAAQTDVAFTRHAEGAWGVPAMFPQTAFAKLLELPADRGAANLASFDDVVLVDPPSATDLVDIDTHTELHELTRRLDLTQR